MADLIEDLRAFVRDEQHSLWYDLDEALRPAVNGVWSMAAADRARRIVAAARLVGPAHWGEVPHQLVAGGVYEAVYAAAGISVELPDEDEWQRLDVLMEKHGGGRERNVPRYAATVAKVCSAQESAWIRGEDE